MRDEEGRVERIKDLSPIALYLAELEGRIRPVTEEDIEKGLNVENLVVYDEINNIPVPTTIEEIEAYMRKFYAVFSAGPLGPWLKKTRN
jgi:hypothetical protein